MDEPTIKNNSLPMFNAEVISLQSQCALSRADQLAHSVGFANITNNRSLLSEAYTDQGILQLVVDQPVDDAIRGGLKIRSPELDDDDILALQEDLEEHADLETYAQGRKWGRLYGGGGLIINAGQDPTVPFDIERIGKKTPLEFYPVDRWELGAPLTGSPVDQYKPMFNSELPFLYYGHPVHHSAVLKFKGKEAPSMFRSLYMGWGMSELERLIRSYNLYTKNQNVVFEMLDESKIDVFGIQGFNSALASATGTQDVAKRVALAAQMKNFQNALVMDAVDTYTQKQLTFSGLSEILSQIRIGMASDCHMPLTKLFGITPTGLGNNDDLENYNCMVETEVRSKDRRHITTILKCRARKLFGFTPRLFWQYQPLRELSPLDQSTVQTQKLNRILAAFAQGLMTGEMAAVQINAENIFPHPILPEEVMSLEEVMETRESKPAPITPGYGAGTSVVTT